MIEPQSFADIETMVADLRDLVAPYALTVELRPGEGVLLALADGHARRIVPWELLCGAHFPVDLLETEVRAMSDEIRTQLEIEARLRVAGPEGVTGPAVGALIGPITWE